MAHQFRPIISPIRPTGTPVWQCGKCKKLFQTKAMTKMHERKVHKILVKV